MTTWTCNTCTLINPIDIKNCEACLNPNVKRIKSNHPNPKTFHKGIVKLTYFQPFEKGNSIEFKDVCIPSLLRKCFLSTFCADLEWLSTQIPNNIPIILATHAPGKRESHEYKTWNESSMIILPPSQGYGAMHIKLFVFWFSDFVRIVLSSAKENIVWMQDFKEMSQIDENKVENQFEKDLKHVLKELGAPLELRMNLNHYDFSNASGHIVYSLPFQDNLQENGHLHLKNCVNRFYHSSNSVSCSVPCNSSDTSDTVNTLNTVNRHFVYQTSSLGSLSPSWLHEFHNSLNGNDPSL